MAPTLYFSLILFLVTFVNGVHSFRNKKANAEYNLVDLTPNRDYEDDGKKFTIYCHEGEPKMFFHTFRTAYLSFHNVPTDYKLYGGSNKTEAFESFTSESIWHANRWFPWRDKNIEFPVFDSYCIGIKASDRYELRFYVRSINFWRLIQMVIGLIFFFTSSKLCRNTLFMYSLAMSFGVLSFFLFFLYLAYKNLMPTHSTKLLLVFGSFPTAFIFHWVYYNVEYMLYQHMQVVIGYVVLSALVSLAAFHRFFGSNMDPKTIDILQVLIRVSGAAMIFFCSENHEVTTAIVVVSVFMLIFGVYIGRRFRHAWLHYFPPKVKLLSETEYIEQGQKETTKALNDLQSFCLSPECKSWQIMERLKHRDRFLSFVNNGSHLTDDELLMHGDSLVEEEDSNITDDDSL